MAQQLIPMCALYIFYARVCLMLNCVTLHPVPVGILPCFFCLSPLPDLSLRLLLLLKLHPLLVLPEWLLPQHFRPPSMFFLLRKHPGLRILQQWVSLRPLPIGLLYAGRTVLAVQRLFLPQMQLHLLPEVPLRVLFESQCHLPRLLYRLSSLPLLQRNRVHSLPEWASAGQRKLHPLSPFKLLSLQHISSRVPPLQL